jgi:hypothetical protein
MGRRRAQRVAPLSSSPEALRWVSERVTDYPHQIKRAGWQPTLLAARLALSTEAPVAGQVGIAVWNTENSRSSLIARVVGYPACPDAEMYDSLVTDERGTPGHVAREDDGYYITLSHGRDEREGGVLSVPFSETDATLALIRVYSGNWTH